MRWAIYVSLFMAALFSCFFGYLWLYRVEFAEAALSRACRPYKPSIHAIRALPDGTLIISDLTLTSQECPDHPALKINHAALQTSYAHWLAYALLPSTSPLILDSLTLRVETIEPLTFLPPSLSLTLNVASLHIIGPGPSDVGYHDIRGSVSEIAQALPNPCP